MSVNSEEWYESNPQEKEKPLIRYAGSAAETSIGSKPMGSELNSKSTLGADLFKLLEILCIKNIDSKARRES